MLGGLGYPAPGRDRRDIAVIIVTSQCHPDAMQRSGRCTPGTGRGLADHRDKNPTEQGDDTNHDEQFQKRERAADPRMHRASAHIPQRQRPINMALPVSFTAHDNGPPTGVNENDRPAWTKGCGRHSVADLASFIFHFSGPPLSLVISTGGLPSSSLSFRAEAEAAVENLATGPAVPMGVRNSGLIGARGPSPAAGACCVMRGEISRLRLTRNDIPQLSNYLRRLSPTERSHTADHYPGP
jgi:hypothetical protein